ncbi:malic enzyme-like NAD(P)-binding protein, partial [Enterobacter roggenkampii]
PSPLPHWSPAPSILSLLSFVRHVTPDLLIGVSGQTGLFTEGIIREMHKHCERPIVMPLSNPTSRVEATPQDIIDWTEGNALVATGSTFDPVVWKDKTYPIAQCNNSSLFPFLFFFFLSSFSSLLTSSILLSSLSPLSVPYPLFPD